MRERWRGCPSASKAGRSSESRDSPGRAATACSVRASARYRARGGGDAHGRAAPARTARCRDRPRRRLPGARSEDRRRRDDDERPGEPDPARPQAVLEGLGSAAPQRDGEDQRMVRAALGQAGERGQRPAEHLQRRQPAEDPVRQVAVPEADGVPARRADAGRRRRGQGRPASRARHGGRGRSRGRRQLE